MFQIGYSRADITPTESVPLAGYGNTSNRMSESVRDPLYSTCTALTDRKPAKAYSAKVYTKDLNFIRHYILEDGHYKGPNFGSQYDSPFAYHTTEGR